MTEPAQSPRFEPEPEGPVDDAGDGDGKGIYWVLKNVVVGPPVKRIFRPKVEGAENIPDLGPAIIASNHLSYADWIFMPLVLRRRVTFVAKSDYFTGAGIKGRFQRGFFKGTGQVPIDRSGGSASEGAIKAGLKVLERGDLFGIYPEGTRSHDDRLILRAVTDEIMYKIMELSGQEYVDMYATKAKSLEGRATTGAPKKVRKSDT
jgi:1-acyl-sn-glycerol-3-phosphate acyltransferase